MKRQMNWASITIAALMLMGGQASANWMDEWSGAEKRQYRNTVKQIERMNTQILGWGNERNASPSTYVLLDPPLPRPKETGPQHVAVEWFTNYLDADGTNNAHKWVHKAVKGSWIPTVINTSWSNIYPLVRTWSVTGGTGLDPYWNEKRRQIRSFRVGGNMYKGAGAEKSRVWERIFEGFAEEYLKGYPSLNNEEDSRRIVEEAGENWEEWKELTTEHVEQTGKEARERWELFAKRAQEQFPDVFAILPDPILLIEGKYLLTLNTVKRQGGKDAPERLFQIANRLVREAGENKVFQEFKTEGHFERIKWDKKRRPEAGEVIELREPFRTQGKDEVEVQWLFTYITDDGHAKDNAWLEHNIGRWQDWLWEDGVDVTVTRGAIVSDSGHFLEHQRRHQRITNAWGGWKSSRQHLLHRKLTEYLEKNPRGIGTDEEERAFVRSVVSEMGYELYVDALTSEESRQRIMELQRKGQLVSELARRAGQRRDPLFLVDGKYLLMTDSTIDTFQSLNWLIGKRMRERGLN